jgi:MoxR-like ATPase
MPAEEFRTTTDAIVANIEQVIEGKTATVQLALAVLLAEGHLLIEDVPGVGKTKLAKALARSIDCSVRRIQFTPDLLPSDVTGVSVYNQETREFEFKPGAVFANIVVGDEINRASPKTQSALLECMEEHQVTVDGVTYALQTPFMVVATQNPIEMEGTYPLPEAQRDRFTARIAMGYPDGRAEIAMLDGHQSHDPLEDLLPVTDAVIIRRCIATVRGVHVAAAVKQYAVELVTATREAPELRLGASPRSTLQMIRTAKAIAALGRPRLRAARRPSDPRGTRSGTPDHPDRRRAARPPHHGRDPLRARAPPPGAARPPFALRHPAPGPGWQQLDLPAVTHARGNAWPDDSRAELLGRRASRGALRARAGRERSLASGDPADRAAVAGRRVRGPLALPPGVHAKP